MAPREATNPFPDQYLTIDYETNVGPIGGMAHDTVAPNGMMNDENNGGGILEQDGEEDDDDEISLLGGNNQHHNEEETTASTTIATAADPLGNAEAPTVLSFHGERGGAGSPNHDMPSPPASSTVVSLTSSTGRQLRRQGSAVTNNTQVVVDPLSIYPTFSLAASGDASVGNSTGTSWDLSTQSPARSLRQHRPFPEQVPAAALPQTGLTTSGSSLYHSVYSRVTAGRGLSRDSQNYQQAQHAPRPPNITTHARAVSFNSSASSTSHRLSSAESANSRSQGVSNLNTDLLSVGPPYPPNPLTAHITADTFIPPSNSHASVSSSASSNNRRSRFQHNVTSVLDQSSSSDSDDDGMEIADIPDLDITNDSEEDPDQDQQCVEVEQLILDLEQEYRGNGSRAIAGVGSSSHHGRILLSSTSTCSTSSTTHLTLSPMRRAISIASASPDNVVTEDDDEGDSESNSSIPSNHSGVAYGNTPVEFSSLNTPLALLGHLNNHSTISHHTAATTNAHSAESMQMLQLNPAFELSGTSNYTAATLAAGTSNHLRRSVSSTPNYAAARSVSNDSNHSYTSAAALSHPSIATLPNSYGPHGMPSHFHSTSHTLNSQASNASGSRHHHHRSVTNATNNINNHNSNYSSSITHGNSASPITLSFGPSTTVSDLKYFAERGCIVPLLAALITPRLKTIGTRMLADYAKMPNRRVAVASNRKILEFVSVVMLELPSNRDEEAEMESEWPAREYAVETIRSLTATEESDPSLMSCPNLLRTLALVARGGPFVTTPSLGRMPSTGSLSSGDCNRSNGMNSSSNRGLASPKARLHACIAVMNLSCGKSNKIEIAAVPEVLHAMRDVMIGTHFATSSSAAGSIAEEARLKAATCVKNLSNADANDSALLGTPGLVEALGHVAATTCTIEGGATTCTTNACLALMNLSISKANKHRVFRTPGVMESLMTVITRTSPVPEGDPGSSSSNNEARVKACSALSNLAIGYDNKIPMFSYPGFVDAILLVIDTDVGEARTKACSILWSFAAEMKNQVPVVQRGDILPTLVRVAEEDHSTEARFKCVAALTLLAESLENAVPLLEFGALHPLMDILHEAGPDPTQWKGQTASWCVGFLMNMAQSDEAVPSLREAGVVELLAPLLTLDHYQSLKAAMAVTFVCRYDADDETYDLLRKTENVIPKIISLLHNTLSGRGGNGYKYGVFTLRSSVGCIASLASGPEFMKERIATGSVFESLLRVVADFCVNGGTPGAIVGGGRDDALSATLAVRALQSLTGHLIPIPGSSALPFGSSMDQKLMTALESFEMCTHPEVLEKTRRLAGDARVRIQGSQTFAASVKAVEAGVASGKKILMTKKVAPKDAFDMSFAATLAQTCCGGYTVFTGADDDDDDCLPVKSYNTPQVNLLNVSAPANVVETGPLGVEYVEFDDVSASSSAGSVDGVPPVRTFLLTDSRTGRRFAVPIDPSGGRTFNDTRIWCYRRGRFCRPGEVPDPNFRWTDELQATYSTALANQRNNSPSQVSSSNGRGVATETPVGSGILGQQ